MVLGFAAYFQLGQDEDPPFTFRAMVVRTNWPGATAQQMAEQVTDKLERTLQEAPYADRIRSYSKPGESHIIFQIKDSSKAADVANVWYSIRKKIGDRRGTLPAGVQGPFSNDDFGEMMVRKMEEGYDKVRAATFAYEITAMPMLTGPLGIAGVAGTLILLGRPFGFVALLGVIALMGMIQRNSVILIDQIEQDRASGVPAWEAIVESAVRRLRPIVLTAAAAVLAMIPLSRSVFWGPMAVAIMGGLIVATVLTLLALPAMYAAWFRVKREDSPTPALA